MTTYHITAEPRPGQNPAPRDCPLMPQDYIADNEREAVDFGESIVTEDAHYLQQRAYDAPSDETDAFPEADEDVGPLFQYSDSPVDTGATDHATAYVKRWRVIARRVDRPAVALMPHGAIDPVVRHGQMSSTAARPRKETPSTCCSTA
jgi:hypothetical protein